MQVRRVRTLVAAGGLLASAGLIGAATQSGTAGAALRPAASTTTTTILPRASAQLVVWADAQRTKVLTPFAKAFGKQYGITVAVQADSGNLEGDFETATEAGKGPDIVVGANDWVGDLVANGVLQPIPMPTIEQKLFDPVAINAMRYQNQIWGVPYAIENVALFRNTSLVKTAPTTFQQMVAEGEALVKAGKAKVPFAVQVGTTGDAYHMEPFYTSAGGYLFGTLKNGDYNPSDVGVGLAGSIRFAKLLYQYGEKGTDVFTQSINSSNAIAPIFTTAESPFLVTGPWALPTIQAAKTPYAISAIPGFAGMGPTRPFLGIQAFYLSSKTKNAALAEQFLLDYIASPKVQAALYGAEPRPAALTSVLDQELKTSADTRAFFAAAKYGQILPGIPAMDQIWGPLGQAEANIVAGANPVTSMQQARAAILKAIKSEK